MNSPICLGTYGARETISMRSRISPPLAGGSLCIPALSSPRSAGWGMDALVHVRDGR
jgi:hypothetical protein